MTAAGAAGVDFALQVFQKEPPHVLGRFENLQALQWQLCCPADRQAFAVALTLLASSCQAPCDEAQPSPAVSSPVRGGIHAVTDLGLPSQISAQVGTFATAAAAKIAEMAVAAAQKAVPAAEFGKQQSPELISTAGRPEVV